jgi:chorismate-pyruvate lyase
MSGAKTASLQRLILASDGMVTPMLELTTGESITTSGLKQVIEPADDRACALLGLAPDQLALIRSTDLRGAVSRQLYLTARSVIDLTALPDELRTGLLLAKEPIGGLLRRLRVESFRELVSIDPPTPEQPSANAREYLIFLSGRPAFLISEQFHFGTLVDVLGAR